MGKWICHNCGNVFESENGSEYDDFDTHVIDCFDADDFFEMIKDEN
jgi:rubredoxin